MKKLSIRIIAIVLCFCMILPIAACNNNTEKPNDDQEISDDFKLSSEYRIVRGEYFEHCDEIILSIQLLRRAVLEVFGEAPVLSDDKRRNESDNSVNEFEILVGDTNRTESKEALSKLGINDFGYNVISKNVIVICGGSPEMTLKAVKKFCVDVLGYNPDTGEAMSANVKLSPDQAFAFTYDYKYQEAFINGVSLKDFTVAIANKRLLVHAYAAADIFTRKTGEILPIKYLNDLSGDEKGVICIGAYDRSGKSGLPKEHDGYVITNSVQNRNVTVGINASNETYYPNALIFLESKLSVKYKDDKILYNLPDEDLLIENKDYDFPKWILQNETSEDVSDGVIYTELRYKDTKNLPYRVCLLTIDPAKVTFDIGTAEDGYAYAPDADKRQSTLDHMKAAVKNGDNVIAGTNAGGFYIQSDYHPYGLTVKDGKFICEGDQGVPYIALTNDGELKFGPHGANANYEDFNFAIGGQYILVNNGIPCMLNMENDLGYTSHPRTIIGVKEDGTVLLAVIDGRQKDLSNGASFAKCTDYMISLGAKTAFAFDGGGSSIMIIRDGNNYDIKNSPSDGSPRKIHNSLLILAKDN